MELPSFDYDNTHGLTHRVELAATAFANEVPMVVDNDPRWDFTYMPRKWADWVTHYTPYGNGLSSTLGLIVNDTPILYTTSKEELDVLAATHPGHIWTYIVLRGNARENLLVAGRKPRGYGYVITTLPWEQADEAVFVPGNL